MDNRCRYCKRIIMEPPCPYEDYKDRGCEDYEPRTTEGVILTQQEMSSLVQTAKEHDLLTILKEKPLSPLHKTFIENSMDYEDYRKETIQWFKSEVVLYTFNEYSKLIEWLKGEN